MITRHPAIAPMAFPSTPPHERFLMNATLLAAVLAAAFLFTACGGGGGDPEIDDATCLVAGQPRPAKQCE